MAAPMTRAERRAAELAARRAQRKSHGRDERQRRLRSALFGALAVLVLGGGIYLAAGDLFGQRAGAGSGAATPVRLSMAGFTPREIRVKAGATTALDLWTTDAAPHLHGGVHTFISDELGIYETLPAAGASGESRRTIAISAPETPGVYDIYCDTCCGGKDSPTMHGRLVVEA